MASALMTNLRTNLVYCRRSKLLLVAAATLAFLGALGVLPGLIGTGVDRLQTLRNLGEQLDQFIYTLCALAALLMVSTPIRDRSLKMILTKPFPIEKWLVSVLLAANLLALVLHFAALMLSLTLAAVWSLPVQWALIAVFADSLLQTSIVVSWLVLLGLLVHPAVAVVVALFLREQLFATFASLLMTVEQRSPKAGAGAFAALENLFSGIYYVLPAFAPNSEKLAELRMRLRTPPGTAAVLGVNAAYALLFGSFCFAVALVALRRRRLT